MQKVGTSHCERQVLATTQRHKASVYLNLRLRYSKASLDQIILESIFEGFLVLEQIILSSDTDSCILFCILYFIYTSPLRLTVLG